MSLYIRSPVDENEGIVIGYATYHKLRSEYLSNPDHSIYDLLYSRSTEAREEFYNICSKHKQQSMTWSEYQKLDSPTKPTTNTW